MCRHYRAHTYTQHGCLLRMLRYEAALGGSPEAVEIASVARPSIVQSRGHLTGADRSSGAWEAAYLRSRRSSLVVRPHDGCLWLQEGSRWFPPGLSRCAESFGLVLTVSGQHLPPLESSGV